MVWQQVSSSNIDRCSWWRSHCLRNVCHSWFSFANCCKVKLWSVCYKAWPLDPFVGSVIQHYLQIRACWCFERNVMWFSQLKYFPEFVLPFIFTAPKPFGAITNLSLKPLLYLSQYLITTSWGVVPPTTSSLPIRLKLTLRCSCRWRHCCWRACLWCFCRCSRCRRWSW